MYDNEVWLSIAAYIHSSIESLRQKGDDDDDVDDGDVQDRVLSSFHLWNLHEYLMQSIIIHETQRKYTSGEGVFRRRGESKK